MQQMMPSAGKRAIAAALAPTVPIVTSARTRAATSSASASCTPGSNAGDRGPATS
jgi:hypothetical protein